MLSCKTFTELADRYQFKTKKRGGLRREFIYKGSWGNSMLYDYLYDIGGYYTLVAHVNDDYVNMPVNNLKSLKKLLTLFYT